MAEVIEKHLRNWDDIKGSTGASLREDGAIDLGHIHKWSQPSPDISG
jgi:hypothetical protein